jgi:hypothetical protein
MSAGAQASRPQVVNAARQKRCEEKREVVGQRRVEEDGAAESAVHLRKPARVCFAREELAREVRVPHGVEDRVARVRHSAQPHRRGGQQAAERDGEHSQ